MKLDIEKLKPCETGLEWYSLQKSSIEAWSNCHRGDWMLWIAMKLGVDKNKLTLASAKCANTVRHLMKDERSTNAVDTLIAYGEGRATLEELKKARDESYSAYSAAMAAAEAAEAAESTHYAARAAAVEASLAADAAFWASDAAYYAAARAADAAAYAAAYYAGAASYYASGESKEAMEANQLETATICREILTDDIVKIIEKIEKH